MGRSPLIQTLALISAVLCSACGGLTSASQTLPDPLVGTVRQGCGPTDGPALVLSLRSLDERTTVELSLWRPRLSEPFQMPLMASGPNAFQGELCHGADCQPIDRMAIQVNPEPDGALSGSFTIMPTEGGSLRAEFQAIWEDLPRVMCG